MAYTKFGEFVRILRIKRHEVMGDMAKNLGTTPAFMSAVENGKKNIPGDWIERLSEIYSLTEEEKTELQSAAEESKTQYKIQTEQAGILQRRAAMTFARSFGALDEETAAKILALLEKQGGTE